MAPSVSHKSCGSLADENFCSWMHVLEDSSPQDKLCSLLFTNQAPPSTSPGQWLVLGVLEAELQNVNSFTRSKTFKLKFTPENA